MKKVILTVVVALATAFISANAFASTMPECPLKNLKKNQLRGADGTAFFPAGARSSRTETTQAMVNRNK